MTVVPPQAWRIVGESLTDDEAFIPMTPRDLDVFRKFQEGPTEEERVRSEKRRAKEEAERMAGIQRLKERHEHLIRSSESGVLTAPLEQHRPHDGEGFYGPTYLECHGCPPYEDFDMCGPCGEAHHEWPCPTWQTISDSTP